MRALFRQVRKRGAFFMMLLRANGIIQDYADRRVLDSVDINIYDGDRIGLVGENGAGKSTLMKILASRLNPDEGSVKCDCPVALVEQFGAGGDDAITGESRRASMRRRTEAGCLAANVRVGVSLRRWAHRRGC